MRHAATWTLGMGAALWMWGCGGEFKPCVSHGDCAHGLECGEAQVCQQPAPEPAPQCVSARQNAGLYGVRVSSASFRGDVGPYRGFNNRACDQAGFVDGSHLTVNTVITSPQGPAMAVFRLKNGLGRPDLSPGKTVTVLGHEDAVVHGCASWASGDWGFDNMSDQVTITVREATNGDWIYDYVAHFPAGLDPVNGSFGAHSLRGSFQVLRPN